MIILRHCGERSDAAIQTGSPRLLRSLAMTALMAIISLNLSACGNKGKLKSPTQIQEAEAKKKAKAERQSDNDEEDDQENLMLMQTEVKKSSPDSTDSSPPPATPGEVEKE